MVKNCYPPSWNHPFKKCIEIADKCFADARMSKTEVDKIMLVGSSTRIPKLHELLKDFFDDRNELWKSIYANEVVNNYSATVRSCVRPSIPNEVVAYAARDHTTNLIIKCKNKIKCILILIFHIFSLKYSLSRTSVLCPEQCA